MLEIDRVKVSYQIIITLSVCLYLIVSKHFIGNVFRNPLLQRCLALFRLTLLDKTNPHKLSFAFSMITEESQSPLPFFFSLIFSYRLWTDTSPQQQTTELSLEAITLEYPLQLLLSEWTDLASDWPEVEPATDLTSSSSSSLLARFFFCFKSWIAFSFHVPLFSSSAYLSPETRFLIAFTIDCTSKSLMY